MPTLLLAGEVDIVTKPDASGDIARQVPAVSLELVDGVNHMGMLERADEYNADIAAFASARLGMPVAAAGLAGRL